MQNDGGLPPFVCLIMILSVGKIMRLNESLKGI